AAIILILVFIIQKFKLNKPRFIILGGLAVAVIIEAAALPAGRWAYNSLMPIIPIIKIGITPAVQLAITGYIVQSIIFRNNENYGKQK
ncbi:MAG: hypothetical protein HYT65_02280, partial [Candidatus Yanofskybacteria bacterium]|nr:hypothetical protein [Candidatus Yanofskybacteria bacterium]